MTDTNKEIIRALGRRLREAADAGLAAEGSAADLPAAMRLSLQRLDSLSSGETDADSAEADPDSAEAGAEMTASSAEDGICHQQQKAASENMQPAAE